MAPIRPTRVGSAQDVQRLIRLRGKEEEVEVRVKGTIKALCDAKPIRRLLHQKMRTKYWCVGGLSKLKALVPVGNKIYQASAILEELIDIAGQPCLVAAVPNDPFSEGARNLCEIGQQLSSSSFMSVQQLGIELAELGMDVGKREKPASSFHGRLTLAHKFSLDVYNQAMDL